jgi:hypothetical protein
MGKRTGKPRGRPKGSKNIRSVEREELLEKVSEKMKEAVPNLFTGDAHMLLMAIYRDPEQPLPVRIDAAKAAIRYEVPALASVETKQDPDQFEAERQRKIASMDVVEIARRVAFVFAEARLRRQEAPVALPGDDDSVERLSS